jgi:hypothetical protein
MDQKGAQGSAFIPKGKRAPELMAWRGEFDEGSSWFESDAGLKTVLTDGQRVRGGGLGQPFGLRGRS